MTSSISSIEQDLTINKIDQERSIAKPSGYCNGPSEQHNLRMKSSSPFSVASSSLLLDENTASLNSTKSRLELFIEENTKYSSFSSALARERANASTVSAYPHYNFKPGGYIKQSIPKKFI